MIPLRPDSGWRMDHGAGWTWVVRRRAAKKGGEDLLAALGVQQTVCLRKLAGSRAEEVRYGRFLRNGAVSVMEMVAAAARDTGRRAAGRHVLAIQDTTEINFAGHELSKRGFGTAGNGSDLGLFLHPVVALDAGHGGIFGLVDAQILNRTRGKVGDRKKRLLAEKESQRWLAGMQASGEVLAASLSVTVVGDRESDIYEAFAQCPQGVHMLVRAAQNRALGDGGVLFEKAAAWPIVDRYVIDVPAKPGQRARRARVALRFGEVRLKRPSGASRELAPALAVSVVDVCEEAPPEGEKPVRWLLLTSHRVATAADARRMVAWYRRRWTIEQVFRTLKTHGFDIEQSQIVEAKTFVKLLTAALIAAIAVMQLIHARDGASGQRLADAATTVDPAFLIALCAVLEGKTVKLKNPHPPDSLAHLAWIVARLGGWSGYSSKGYKPPGPKTMHDGLLRFEARQAGWELAKNV